MCPGTWPASELRTHTVSTTTAQQQLAQMSWSYCGFLSLGMEAAPLSQPGQLLGPVCTPQHPTFPELRGFSGGHLLLGSRITDKDGGGWEGAGIPGGAASQRRGEGHSCFAASLRCDRWLRLDRDSGICLGGCRHDGCCGCSVFY